MPRDGRPTRERILQVAHTLMTDQGYNATSLDQVIAESSSSKGAFFHHFGSKADLAVKLLERYVASDLAHLDAGLAATASIQDPIQRVVAFLRFYEDGAEELMAEQSGCLYATVLAEREFIGTEINHQVAKAEQRWRLAFGDLLRAALVDSAIDLDVDALADHLFTTFEGGFILSRTLQDPSAMKRQLRTFRRLVEVLLIGGRTGTARPTSRRRRAREVPDDPGRRPARRVHQRSR